MPLQFQCSLFFDGLGTSSVSGLFSDALEGLGATLDDLFGGLLVRWRIGADDGFIGGSDFALGAEDGFIGGATFLLELPLVPYLHLLLSFFLASLVSLSTSPS